MEQNKIKNIPEAALQHATHKPRTFLAPRPMRVSDL